MTASSSKAKANSEPVTEAEQTTTEPEHALIDDRRALPGGLSHAQFSELVDPRFQTSDTHIILERTINIEDAAIADFELKTLRLPTDDVSTDGPCGCKRIKNIRCAHETEHPNFGNEPHAPRLTRPLYHWAGKHWAPYCAAQAILAHHQAVLPTMVDRSSVYDMLTRLMKYQRASAHISRDIPNPQTHDGMVEARMAMNDLADETIRFYAAAWGMTLPSR